MPQALDSSLEGICPIDPSSSSTTAAPAFSNIPERYNFSVLLDANIEAGRGDAVAIICGELRVTYAELHAAACAVGRALLSLGVRREERVLLILDDTPTFAMVFWGVVRIGAIPVPVNPLLRTLDYRHFAEDTHARVVVAEPGYQDKVVEALEGLADPPRIITTDDRRADAVQLNDLIAAHRGELSPADTHRDDIAMILYSGGSTGRPKGIVHLHHDVPYTCESYAGHILQLKESDVIFTRALFHAYGLLNGVTCPAWAGATVTLLRGRPTPKGVLEVIARDGASVVLLVPTLYNAIVRDPENHSADLSSVRLCLSGAEPLQPEVWRRWKDVFGLHIFDCIGSTEVGTAFCANTSTEFRLGSAGKPAPGFELCLLDDEGQSVPDGETGDLYVKGASTAPFYWHQHAKSQRTMRGEWINTGDRFHRDSDGFYWYVGRSDDMIKVRGEWLSPIAVENLLSEHPSVREAAVVGLPNEGVTTIKATVVLANDHQPSQQLVDELQEWCKEKLQRYQYPSVIDFVAELPKTAAGKIERFRLREMSS